MPLSPEAFEDTNISQAYVVTRTAPNTKILLTDLATSVSGGLLFATVLISAAAVTTLHSAPATIVSAPGTSKIIVPKSWAGQYADGTANFGNYQGADPTLTFGATTNKISAVSSSGNLLSTSNNFVFDSFSNGTSGILIASVANQPVLYYHAADFGKWGAITAVAVTLGQGGTGYVVGDLFGIDPNQGQSSGDAIGRVVTASGGAALTVAVTGTGTNAGTSYTSATAQPTNVHTGGGDGTLQVDLTVATAQTGRVQIDFAYQIINQLV